MTGPGGRLPSTKVVGLWAVVGVLLTPAIVLPLITPLYDSATPRLWGFPFYFWFQFALILVACVLTVASYLVARTAYRLTRSERNLPAATSGESAR